ncbi:helix-turn-helix transcriptional regulator [Magnetospirillum molischianum]|uniref:Transcription activator transcription regulator protein n=1 Tax=Magnetospirillum molischianum DSM 120 TaxID=1150626 RepID=H8FS71_MAGML|nr:AraC family transcriptional regulator [Magnetospirillum molischianum]CCG41209.1 Transcription activator transcription regulator protein [Magnetospirillum molischianum DSM 120]
MSFLPPGPIQPEIPASALLRDVSVLRLDSASACDLITRRLQDGIELLIWRGRFSRPLDMTIRDDSERIHFTFTLRGRSWLRFEDGGGREHLVEAGGSCISFNPGCRGRFSQQDQVESVTVMIRPDLFEPWCDGIDTSLQRALGSGRCVAAGRAAAELTAAAAGLVDGAERRPPLWLLGQSLTLVGLALETHTPPAAVIPPAERRKLVRARDRLLADLSQPPTIADLAREVHLSAPRLKRGFRQLFDSSIYGLFQRERMYEAHHRLSQGESSVLGIASELGYTNASHFAAAFRKQFGINPSALKRSS